MARVHWLSSEAAEQALAGKHREELAFFDSAQLVKTLGTFQTQCEQ